MIIKDTNDAFKESFAEAFQDISIFQISDTPIEDPVVELEWSNGEDMLWSNGVIIHW